MAALLLILGYFIDWQTAVAYLFGGTCSVLADVRTTEAARSHGQDKAQTAAILG